MKFINALALVLIVTCALAAPAMAKVRIDLTNPNADPVPVAVVKLVGDTPEENDVGGKLREVITGNLSHSALFNVVEEAAYLQTGASIRLNGPLFNDWRLLNVEAMLSGTVQIIPQGENNKIRVEFRLYDVHGEKQLVGRRYTVDEQFWRYIGHKISDDIYQAMTGEAGYFASRIVFIEETPDNKNYPMKRLCVMDQDGANYQCLTDGSHLVLTPRFNPQLQKIIYMSYANELPRLYLLDLPTGKQEIVGDFEGLNSSPRFAPDAKTVAMTLTKDHAGNPEIYTMDMATKTLKRLTFHRGIDTSPSYSPDGDRIVFNSDRGGKPALYIMDKDGGNVTRLTYGSGSYYAPVWSPRGDLIAFVKGEDGRFSIGVIDPEGKEERLLTDSFLDESPTWSPNGRVILFARQMGDKNRIYSIDLTGYNERQLPTPHDASDPAWSPLFP